jgi:hypothetical protein
MKDYNLIIQGPILSPGRTGKTLNDPLTKEAIVDFRCEQTIIDTIEKYGHHFGKILVVTWQSEEFDESLLSPYPNCEFIKLVDLAPTLVLRKQRLPTDFNNKFKQFYACAEAAQRLQQRDEKFILKIRTDQLVDLDRLLQEHRHAVTNDSSKSNKVFVPYIVNQTFMISDFYILSEKKTFEKFCSSMLWGNYLEFNSSVHLDLSLKYAYVEHREKLNISTRTYFLNSFNKHVNSDKITLRNYLVRYVYEAFSKELIETTIWRGDTIRYDYDDGTVNTYSARFNDLYRKEGVVRKVGLKDLLYINIPSYVVVKLPFLRGTFIHSWLKKAHKQLIKMMG